MKSLKRSPSFTMALARAKALDPDLEREIRAELERRGELDEIRDICRSLMGLAQVAWPILEPDQELKWGWAMDAIADHLQAISAGQISKLLITVPPGMMKSLMSCVFFPAWEWGPRAMSSKRFLCASFSDDRANRDVRRMRDLVTAPWYQALWPNVQVTRSTDADFGNSATGWRKSSPMRSLTGERGDRLIIDDPQNPEGTESEAERRRALRIFQETVPTRLNDPRLSAAVVIMQRLHQNDVAGLILSKDLGYEHLMLPMEYEPDRALPRNSIKFKDPRRREGELLFPERFDEQAIRDARKQMTPYAYAAQFQQNPVPRGGGMFKEAWLPIVDSVPAGGTWARAWDLAATRYDGMGDPDWTVGLKGNLSFDGKFTVTDMVRFRGDPGAVDRAVLNFAEADGRLTTIRLPQDPAQAGRAQADRFARMLAGYPLDIVRPSGDKQTRARVAASQAEWGNIRLLRGPWNDDFLAEVTSFPTGKHDDIVDALADLIDTLTRKGTYNLDALVGD